MALGDHVLAWEMLLVAPEPAHALVQEGGIGLGEPVGEGLEHDRVVVVVLGREAGGQLFGADPGRDRKGAGVVP